MIRNRMSNTVFGYNTYYKCKHAYISLHKCVVFHNVLSAHVNIVERKALFIVKHQVPKVGNNLIKD